MNWKALWHHQARSFHVPIKRRGQRGCQHTRLQKCSHQLLPLWKSAKLVLPSASYLPIIIYPGASFLFPVLVSLRAFAEGLRHFGNSVASTQIIGLLMPPHPRFTLCVIVSTNLLPTDFTAYWLGFCGWLGAHRKTGITSATFQWF